MFARNVSASMAATHNCQQNGHGTNRPECPGVESGTCK